MRMDLVRELLATLRIEPQDIADSGLSPHDRLDRLSTDEIRDLGLVAAPELVNHWDTPIGAMLPGLLRTGNLNRCRPLPSRRAAYNASAFALHVDTWGDVAELTPAQLFGLRNVGWLTVIDILTSSVEQSLRSHQAR